MLVADVEESSYIDTADFAKNVVEFVFRFGFVVCRILAAYHVEGCPSCFAQAGKGRTYIEPIIILVCDVLSGCLDLSAIVHDQINSVVAYWLRWWPVLYDLRGRQFLCIVVDVWLSIE